MSEGFKGSSWAPELPTFNWKPRSLSSVSLLLYFFFLAIYCHLAYLFVLYVPLLQLHAHQLPESRNAVPRTGCTVPETDPTRTVTRATRQDIYHAKLLLQECVHAPLHTPVHPENRPKKAGHILRCGLSLGSRVECNCNF